MKAPQTGSIPNGVKDELRLPTAERYLAFIAPVVLLTITLAMASFLALSALPAGWGRVVFEVFWVEEESNVPTFVNFALLAIASALALTVGFSPTQPWRRHWIAFGLLLLFMAFDESAQVHEPVGRFLTSGIEGRGAVLYSWVIVGLGVVGLLLLLGFRFILALPRAVRVYLIAGWGVFVAGALGFEMLNGVISTNGWDFQGVATLLEETFELTGAALFGATALKQLMLSGRAG